MLLNIQLHKQTLIIALKIKTLYCYLYNNGILIICKYKHTITQIL